jgi:hypothetical protein
VLEAGVARTLDEPFGWEHATFALAGGFDESTKRYVYLRLPGDSAPLSVTGSTLLVRPDVALVQRAAEDAERRVVDPPPPGPGPGPTPPPPPPPTRPGPAPRTRFFGVRTLDPQKYGKDFAVVVEEVLQRLSATEAQLEVKLEISATKSDGFGDDVVRTVSENAGTLRFDQSGFDTD